MRAAFLAGLAVLAGAAPAQAATFTVNTTADTAPGTTCTAVACTLRGAIAAATANGNAADDVIVVPAGTYTLNAQLGGLTVPSSATRITFDGAGANATIIQPPADTTMRVLTVGSSAAVAIEGLTLRNGLVTGGSGGNLLVSSQAAATLTGVRITGGRAPRGGGIATTGAGSLTLARTLVDGNSATGTTLTDPGGGLYVEGQTSATAVTITDSTIAGNSARNGAGIGVVNNTGQPPALRGVTLARNNARAGAGGIGVGGIYSQNTNARFQGSIVAFNTTTVNTGPAPVQQPANCALASAAVDEGGNVENVAQCGLAGQNTDPLLATTLAPTAEPPVLTIPSNSPAVDRAGCGGRTLDQRGLSRPQGTSCDSGAFEVDTAATMTIATGPAGTVNTRDVQFTFSADQPGVTPVCRLAGPGQSNTFVACLKPDSQSYSGLADGAYTFAVRDGAFASAPIATRSFTVDLTPPAAPEVVSGPAGPTTDTAPAFAFSATETVTCRLEGPVTRDFESCASPKSFGVLPPGDYVFIVRAADGVGNASETRRAFTVTAPQAAATPTPTVTPAPTPTPTASRVVVAPAAGTISVRLPGARSFDPLDASRDIPFGSEVDARKGRVTLTALPTAGKPPETAVFYDGRFTIHKAGGFIELRLSEKLTGCPKARGKAALAQKKPKSRKLWGDGKGKFRTRGQYSAATVRGTRWLVQDTCTTTLTRVTQGVVAVNDFAKRKTVLVKRGKRYTARPNRR